MSAKRCRLPNALRRRLEDPNWRLAQPSACLTDLEPVDLRAWILQAARNRWLLDVGGTVEELASFIERPSESESIDDRIAAWLAVEAEGLLHELRATADPLILGTARYGLARSRYSWRFLARISAFFRRFVS